MAKLTILKQEIVDNMLTIIQKEMVDMKYSQYERRVFLMVETALHGGESAFAELLLRNYLGRFDLANTLTWVNKVPKKSSVASQSARSFWSDL